MRSAILLLALAVSVPTQAEPWFVVGANGPAPADPTQRALHTAHEAFVRSSLDAKRRDTQLVYWRTPEPDLVVAGGSSDGGHRYLPLRLFLLEGGQASLILPHTANLDADGYRRRVDDVRACPPPGLLKSSALDRLRCPTVMAKFRTAARLLLAVAPTPHQSLLKKVDDLPAPLAALFSPQPGLARWVGRALSKAELQGRIGERSGLLVDEHNYTLTLRSYQLLPDGSLLLEDLAVHSTPIE